MKVRYVKAADGFEDCKSNKQLELGNIYKVELVDSQGDYWCKGKDGLTWCLLKTEVEVIEDEPQTDSIVESVINQFKQRSEAGINKYGTTLDRNDLTPLQWIEHAKQEAMDFILYLEKLKQELK